MMRVRGDLDIFRKPRTVDTRRQPFDETEFFSQLKPKVTMTYNCHPDHNDERVAKSS